MPKIETPNAAQVLAGRVLLQPNKEIDTAQSRREFECVFMQPGYVMRQDSTPSNWLIPAATIRDAEHLFDARSVYVDHPEMFGFGWHQDPKVKDLAGVTFSPRWLENQQALVGGIRLYDEDPTGPGAFVGALLDQILADKEEGLEVPPVGLSAVLWHESELDEETGARVSTRFTYIQSVDFVYSAGAGGYVRAALQAIGADRPRQFFMPATGLHQSGAGVPPQSTQGGIEMNDLNTTPAGGEGTSVTPPSQDQLVLDTIAALAAQVEELGQRIDVASFAPPADPDPSAPSAPSADIAQMQAEIGRLSKLVAAQEERQTVEGMGDPPRGARLFGGLDSLERIQLAADAMFAGIRPQTGIRPLTGIRELYMLLSGDYSLTGMFQDENVYLAAVTSSTMAAICANALNKRVINEFMQYPQWWAPAVTEEDFATLQDARWISLGGVGELPTVSEGAAYTEMTWDDFVETDAFVKKGGYLGITLEAIDKDDTRRVTAAPRALAQAAWLTLGKSISAIFTDSSGTGPTMSDSNHLFDAGNHSNLLTTALSYAQWEVVKIAMMKQTEINSSERLGALTRPHLLWVPVDLETTAIQILASEGEPGTADNDINVNATGEGREERLRRARTRVIVCPLWTDMNNWAAQADPRLYPSIGIGYRFGRTPEIFSVADPRAGLMFTNDVMPVKVRFFYAVGPTDWRGLHKSNV